MHKTRKLILVVFLFLTISIMAQGPEPKSVPITDEPTKKALTDAYRAILNADKDFQIILLKARIKYKVDESWTLNFDTMTFTLPKEEKKDSKP